MQVKDASLHILKQLSALIKVLNDQQFTASSKLLTGSSIGKHIRHIIEFYDILIHSYYTGNVDYDAREHDGLLEKERLRALFKVEEIKAGLDKITEDFPLQMHASFSTNDMEKSIINSSVKRELAFNLEHAIHHMAIVKMVILSIYPEVVLPKNFGVAYSTIRYEYGKNKKDMKAG
ncbi:MAG: DinB family protein [Bacteroidota bacterium]